MSSKRHSVRACAGLAVLVALFALLFSGIPTNATAAPAWINISPPDVSTDFNNPPNNYGFQTIVLDPRQSGIAYVGTTYQGLWKTTDAGETWAKIDTGSNASALDGGRLWALAIDPVNPLVLYTTSGYGANGIWKSTDGGVDWNNTLPADIQQLAGDVYDLTIDPYNHNHILATEHSAFNIPGGNAPLLESLDAGGTWTVHSAPASANWGIGHYVYFLDDSSTWLLFTQTAGIWRTVDAGETWTQVSLDGMPHGAEFPYRATNGVLYAGLWNGIGRSADDGLSWTHVPGVPYAGYYGVIGDGSALYAAPATTGSLNTPTPYYSSPETDGVHWAVHSAQTFIDGPQSIAYDPVAHTLYSSNWEGGVWKLHVGASGATTATAEPTATAGPAATATAPPGLPGPKVLGNAAVGAQADSDDADNMNGSRFTTGGAGGAVASVSVYVGAVDAAPRDQYQLAIYTDRNGAPDALIAHSGSATLVTNNWNTLPVQATLAPGTAYWLMYNTNAGGATLNDLRYDTSASVPMAWSASGVPFGAWPAAFGPAATSTGAFSIYASYR